MDVEEDSIRSLLEKGVADAATADAAPVPAAEQTAAPAAETAEQKADRLRDEGGRFATPDKARETLTIKSKTSTDPAAAAPAPATQQAAATPPAATTSAKPDEPGAPPPIEWKGAAKVDWQRLPKNVQAAIRETYDAVAQDRAEVAPLREMIDTARPLLVREAGSVQEGIRQLLAFHQLSVDKPVDLALHILRARGIDPRVAFGGQPAAGQQPQGQQPQPGIQPQVPDVRSIVAQLVQQELQPLRAQVEQRETQQYVTTIEAFRADPAHPYFNEVSQHMGFLLKAGHAKDMQEAYDQATWANPVIRSALMQQQTEDAAKARAAEVAKAEQANRASLTGAPTPGAVPAQGASDGSIRGDLMRALKAQTGAV